MARLGYLSIAQPLLERCPVALYDVCGLQCAHLSEKQLRWEIYGKSIDNLWEIYGKSMVHFFLDPELQNNFSTLLRWDMFRISLWSCVECRILFKNIIKKINAASRPVQKPADFGLPWAPIKLWNLNQKGMKGRKCTYYIQKMHVSCVFRKKNCVVSAYMNILK